MSQWTGEKFFVHPTAIMDAPMRPLQGFDTSSVLPEINRRLPSQLYVGPFCIVGQGVTFGERVILDEYCRVGRGVEIGDDVLITHRASVGGFAIVQEGSVIGGMVSENCFVGKKCRIFGRLIHKQLDTVTPWDKGEPEPSVKILDNSFVAFGAILSGGITVGPNAYVCSGAIITRDVPPMHVGFNVNQVIESKCWKGPLRYNPIFDDS